MQANAQPQVFTQHLARWSLAADGEAIETHTSHLLPVLSGGGGAFLKVFKASSDEKRSGEILRHFSGAGAVKVLADDGEALLLERAGPATLLSSVADDREALHAALGVIAQLHASPPRAVEGSIALYDWFSALFQRANESALHARCAAMAEALLAAPQQARVLHGDIHHGNILASARGWLAIDPKGLWGESAYEVANLFGNPLSQPHVFLDRTRMIWLARESAVRLGLDVERVLQFAFAFAGLAASWPGDPGEVDTEPALRLESAAILQDILSSGDY